MSATLTEINAQGEYVDSATPKYRAKVAAVAADLGHALRRGCETVIKDLVEAFKLFAQGFAEAPGEVRKAIIHGIVYLLMFVVFFSGCFLIRADFDPMKAAREAYQHSWLSPTQGYSQIHSQDALKAGIKSDVVVTKLLNRIMAEAPYASRVRLALIHDGIATITGIEMLRFDVVNAVAAPGRDPGELLTNRSLSEWAPDYLPALMRHECLVQDVSKMQNAVRKDRLSAMGVTWVLGCPVIDVNDQIFGSILTTWDGNDKPPTGAALTQLISRIQSYSQEIGAALDMQKETN